MDNQVDYIINSGQYITTKPQYELIEKVDILSVIMSMFDSEKYRTNIYGIKEKVIEERIDGVKRDINTQIIDVKGTNESSNVLLSPKDSSSTSTSASSSQSMSDISILNKK